MLQGDSIPIPDRMAISLSELGGVDKSKLMMLELLANCNWERPIYVAMTVGQDNYMNLGNHFVQEGLAYRITPFTTNVDGSTVPGMTNFDTETTYNNVMNRFKFGGADTKGIYLDETVTRMCLTHRMLMVDLASHLSDEGKDDKALKVLEKLDSVLPAYNIPYDIDSREIDGRRLGFQDGKSAIYTIGSSYREALLYAKLSKPEKARPIIDQLWRRCNQYLDFYLSMSSRDFMGSQIECLKQFNAMTTLLRAYYSIDEKKAEECADQLEKRCGEFAMKGGDLDKAHWQY